MISLILITSGIIFIASIIRSALGFGEALIAMPLLVMILGLSTATPIVGLVALTLSVIILQKDWRLADFKLTWRLVLTSLMGVPIGLLMLKGVADELMQGLLGIVLIAYGLYKLVKPEHLLKEDRFGLVYLFGFLSGILGGAYNTNGPLVVIYANLRRWPPQQFRSTMQSYFLPIGFFTMIGQGVAGLWTTKVITLYLSSLPLIFLAVYIGRKVHMSFAPHRFDRIISTVLLLMGLLLLIRVLVN